MKGNSELVYVAAWVMSLNEDEISQAGSDQWDPPAEMDQFGFLVGEWEGRGTISQDNNSIARECTVQWRAQRLLDGWAIQDEIGTYSPNGKLLSRSTLLRTYSVDRECWKVVELRLPGQQITEYQAQRAGETMVMHGLQNNGNYAHRVRFTYHDIYRDSFKMRMAVSADGLKWKDSILRFELKRK